jgi:hypothetical protein
MIHRPPSIPTSKQHKAASPTRRPYHKSSCFSQIRKICCRPTTIKNTEDINSPPSFTPPLLLVPENDIGDNCFFLVAPSKVNKPPRPEELTASSSSSIHHFLKPRLSKTQCHPCYYEQTELYFFPIFDGKQPSKPSPAHLLPPADIMDYASLNQTMNTLVVSTSHHTPPTRAAIMLKPRGKGSTKNAAPASSLSLPFFPIW